MFSCFRRNVLIMNRLLFILSVAIFPFYSCGQVSKPLPQKTNTVNILGSSSFGIKEAVFGFGCFWCSEAIFEPLDGIVEVVSGYSGGKEENPSYKEVSSGSTGHAEAILIRYNPIEITFETLVEMFFAAHDPTQINRQGPDIGRHYRSVIFYKNEEEKAIAEKIITALEVEKRYNKPIATTIEPLSSFWEAEAYHQDYIKHNPNVPYVKNVSLPKIAKFRQLYGNKVKSH